MHTVALRSAPRWKPGLEEGGKDETRRGREREQAGGDGEGAVHAFLSSRGFVCNNLCGETA